MRTTEPARGTLRIGTCSWKYPSWSGLVYSQPAGIDYLAEYARRYGTVEVDQWFWSLFPGGKVRLPDAADVEAYRASVDGAFRFTVKAPNSLTLTHAYSRGKGQLGDANPRFLSAELAGEFMASLSPLHDVLGPVIFQFEYLNRQKMPSARTLEKHLADFRDGLPPPFEYAVEVRNPNYLTGAFLDFLASRGLCPVLLQGYWMPPVAALIERERERLARFPTVVLRLHGPDREDIEAETGKRWDRIVRPRDEELGDIARGAAALVDAGVSVYVNVNNHYEGSAPLTIGRFMEHYGAGDRRP